MAGQVAYIAAVIRGGRTKDAEAWYVELGLIGFDYAFKVDGNFGGTKVTII